MTQSTVTQMTFAPTFLFFLWVHAFPLFYRIIYAPISSLLTVYFAVIRLLSSGSAAGR